MSKKVVKLQFQNEFEFLLAGLISGYKDYRLCFELNTAMKLNFKRNKDVILEAGRPGSSTRHSYFIDETRAGVKYHVISNRDKEGTGFLIPEMKNIDFFLIVSEAPGNYDMEKLIRQAREIEIISGVYEIDPYELKSADTFLLILEA